MSPSLIWFLLGAAFFVAELFVPGFVLLFFGVGCWAAAGGALLHFDLNWQITVFICVTILTLLVLRQRLRIIFGGKSQSNDAAAELSDIQPHPLTGQRGTVSRSITPGKPGEVNAGGSFWRAVAADSIPSGTEIVVLGADAQNTLLLRVAPANAMTPRENANE